MKLWSFYVDLQESLGTVEEAKAVYDKILELRIANAQVIVNYAAFLEENKYFEESFKVGQLFFGAITIFNYARQVYERGVELFTYPVSFEIWNIYLSKFVKRYVSNNIHFLLTSVLCLIMLHRAVQNWNVLVTCSNRL
jgi:pre-mRNA-splicing factor SYF1